MRLARALRHRHKSPCRFAFAPNVAYTTYFFFDRANTRVSLSIIIIILVIR